MSAILSANDLNDFISPGVACIKPVETFKPSQSALKDPYEVTTEETLQAETASPAQISLTDCLACSGCVTSAEAVLISLQSHAEVLNTLDAYPSISLSSVSESSFREPTIARDGKIFVASVSPQVRASLAATYGITERQATHLIDQLLSGSHGLRSGGRHGSHFSFVVDSNRMREACLVLSADEVRGSFATGTSQNRPILSSACPGWICYAEKTHPHVLPHLSTLKSPQALTGTILKSVLSRKLGLHPSQIWHLAIMPCFDKKLEASREELTDQWWRAERSENEPLIRDVDCVITSRELLTLAHDRGIQLSSLPLRPLRISERPVFPDSQLHRFLFRRPRRHSGHASEESTSGGYLYHVLKTHQFLHPGSRIHTQRGRNADVVEYNLTSTDNVQLFKCARFYGFRNIQNLVRKLKPARASKLPGAARRPTATSAGTDYAYVEVMACPGGCTNGGGQLKPEDSPGNQLLTSMDQDKPSVRAQREWLQHVDEAYFSADSDGGDISPGETYSDGKDLVMTDAGIDPEPDDLIHGISPSEIHTMLDRWMEVTGVPLEKLVMTSFRKVESDIGKKTGVGDTERVAAIAGSLGGGW